MRYATFAVLALTAAFIAMVPIAAQACSGAAKSAALPLQTADAASAQPAATPMSASPILAPGK